MTSASVAVDLNRIFFLSVVVFAASSVVADETDEVVDEVVDEITVMGVRDLGALRAELARVEDEVYDLYNDINDDDDYDIVCRLEARIGSQIKRRVCHARIYRDALAEATDDDNALFLYGGSVLNEKKHNLILREKMAAAANQNPELIAALRKRLALEKKFELEREKRFGSDDD